MLEHTQISEGEPKILKLRLGAKPKYLKNKRERGHKGVDKRFCFGFGFANEL